MFRCRRTTVSASSRRRVPSCASGPRPTSTVIEAGAGENWHDFVTWTLDQGFPGLENLALIPGTIGAAPVQNVGAYGVELQDRFESLDAIDLMTGREFTLDASQ